MAKRRPAGDGLVRKRSDGRWEGRIVVGHKADGSPIFRSVFAKTQGELLKKLHSRMEEYRDVELTEESGMTLGQWLDKWLADYMTLTVRESTLNSYKNITEHHIKPLLGDEKIGSITTGDIQKMYNWLRENGRVNEHFEKGNALSDTFIRRVHMMLHQALDVAVRERLIPKNPTEGTIIPKVNYAPKQILTEAQLQKFLDVVRQLIEAFCPGFAQHVFRFRHAVIIIPDDNPALPAPVFSFSQGSGTAFSFLSHGVTSHNLVQESAHNPRRFAVHIRGHVGVSIQREGCVGVSQNSGQGFGIHAAVQGMGRERMSQIVETNEGKLRVFQQGFQVPVCAGRIHGQLRHRGIVENPLAVGFLLPLFQDFRCAGRQENGSCAGFRFRFAHPDTAALPRADRAVDMEPAGLVIEVLPLETADLATAHSRGQLRVEEVRPHSILNKLREECAPPIRKCREDMPFGEWISFWYEIYCKPQISPRTQEGYADRIYKHIIPELGQIPLNKLTQNDLQQFYARLKTSGRLIRVEQFGPGLSDRMVRVCHASCRSALEKAVQEGLIRINPAIGCKLPPKKSREMQVLTQEEMQRFLIQARQDGYYELFLLELGTGMRLGEILALQWTDLNFRTGELRIDKSMCYLGGKLQITEPKTKSSIRTVILPPALLEVLKAYQQTVDSRWMFPSPAKANAPLTQNYVRRRMQQTLKRAGCKVVRFHDLRHTFATMALEHGMDVKTLSTIIGHVSSATTLDIYSHVTDLMQQQAAVRIDRQIGKTDTPMPTEEARATPRGWTSSQPRSSTANPAPAASTS